MFCLLNWEVSWVAIQSGCWEVAVCGSSASVGVGGWIASLTHCPTLGQHEDTTAPGTSQEGDSGQAPGGSSIPPPARAGPEQSHGAGCQNASSMVFVNLLHPPQSEA